MNLAEYEQIQPNAQAAGLTFLTPNQQCAWRVKTLFTKEPDTIEWLNNMHPGEMLFDVGANMGQYAMLAAKRGLTVHAFEPEAQNFALLVRNIALNNLSELCTAWPLALSNYESLQVLHLSGMSPGGSCHSYGESKNFRGEAHTFPFKQGSVATTLANFARRYGSPHYIKIDVDGFEHFVIEGGIGVVEHCKSVLIEINTGMEEHRDLISHMTNGLGFHFDSAQAESSRRKEGPFTGVGNIIFYKD